MAAGVFNTARLTGEVVAIAVLGAILTAATSSHLTHAFGRSSARLATGRLLQGDMSAALSTLGSSGLRATAAGAYTDAMHLAFWSLTALMAIGTIAIAILTAAAPSRDLSALARRDARRARRRPPHGVQTPCRIRSR